MDKLTDFAKLLRSALDNAPLILFAIDTEGNITALEGGGLPSLELEPGSNLGKSAFKVKNVPITRSLFKKVISGSEFSATMDISGVIYETFYTPTYNSDGNITGCTGFSIDVSKRIELEQSLDEERYKATRAQQLNSLAEMASGITHEINNPLAIISGYSQQLADMADDDIFNSDQLLKVSQKLVNTCSRMSKIITALQDFSRDATNDPFTEERVKDIIENTLEVTRNRFIASNIQLEINNIPDSHTIQCRPIQISQALFNLLTNSLEVLKNQEQGMVKIECRDVEENIELTITDNSPAKLKELYEKVLRPFPAIQESSSGAGLGLSSARTLIESHGGTLTLAEEHTLTCFVISLPKKQSEEMKMSV